MTTHEKLLILISQKLAGLPPSLLPGSLIKALVQLEEEGHPELAGISAMITDDAMMELFGGDEPEYEPVED